MTDESEALDRFKAFVASIEYSEDHIALATKLGEAKGLWAEAALSLACVRQVSIDQWLYNAPEAKASQRDKAIGQQLLLTLNLVKPVKLEDRRF